MARGPVPSPKRYAVRIGRVAGEFTRLPPEVRRVLRLCDGTRSLARLKADAALPVRTFAQVLSKLERLGYVEPNPPPARGAATSPAPLPLEPLPLEPLPLDPLALDPLASDPLAFDPLALDPLASSDPLASPDPLRSDPMPGLEAKRAPQVVTLREFTEDEEAFFSQSIEHLLEPEERSAASG